jgi:hypothetical protein
VYICLEHRCSYLRPPPSDIKPCMILPRFKNRSFWYWLQPAFQSALNQTKLPLRWPLHICYTSKRCGWNLYGRPLVSYPRVPGTSRHNRKRFDFHAAFDQNSNRQNNFLCSYSRGHNLLVQSVIQNVCNCHLYCYGNSRRKLDKFNKRFYENTKPLLLSCNHFINRHKSTSGKKC